MAKCRWPDRECMWIEMRSCATGYQMPTQNLIASSYSTNRYDYKKNHVLTLQPLFWDEETSGAGASITYDADNADVIMTVTNEGEFAIRQTFERFNYQSGKVRAF